jgi:hypothetical protein
MRIVGMIACLVVAAIYVVVWPGWKREGEWSAGARFILRWFHSLTWVLLAAWILMRQPAFGIASLLCYMIFLATWLSVARRSTSQRNNNIAEQP